MTTGIGLIGFGEAGSGFATAGRWRDRARAYDIKTDIEAVRQSKLEDYRAACVTGCESLGDALRDMPAVVSLVTADQALEAALAAAPLLSPGALYFDMNSVAPDTKRAAAGAIEAAAGRYVDVAVMAPVHPARLDVPLLVGGPHAEEGAAVLRALGFTNVRVVAGEIGAASSIKMIRSVMVKGLEALTAECMLAAHAAGVAAEVIASLDASDRPKPWAERADYNLDRMLVHGLRRAAEMEEVVKTLQALGTGSILTEGTVARQRALGKLAVAAPPEGLAAKVSLILDRKADHQ